ncbi:MAG: DUF2178 domain-containing protein [Methanobrevibacter sp.]|nr:DUF2178 domain-containing protein [Methanobrevibacter sp.]
MDSINKEINRKIKGFSIFLLVIILALAWIIGMIFADLKFFIFGVFILAFLIIVIYKSRDDLKILRNKDGTAMKDERNEFISEKAGYHSFETMMPIIVFAGVAILTLRDIYPEYIILAYNLFSIAFLGFIIKRIAIIYYKKKYD